MDKVKIDMENGGFEQDIKAIVFFERINLTFNSYRCNIYTNQTDLGKLNFFDFKSYKCNKMGRKCEKTGHPLSVTIPYSDMENYEKLDRFLKDCENGRSGSTVMYEIRRDGGINRKQFLFDGNDMYGVSTSGVWLENDTPGIAYMTCTRIKEWEYTENGWFCYELCTRTARSYGNHGWKLFNPNYTHAGKGERTDKTMCSGNRVSGK